MCKATSPLSTSPGGILLVPLVLLVVVAADGCLPAKITTQLTVFSPCVCLCVCYLIARPKCLAAKAMAALRRPATSCADYPE